MTKIPGIALLAAFALAIMWQIKAVPEKSGAAVSTATNKPDSLESAPALSADSDIAKRMDTTADDAVTGADAFVVLAKAKSASHAYRELLPRARSGEFAAIEAANALNKACHYLYRNTKHAPVNDSTPGSAVFIQRQEAMSRRKEFCDDFASFQVVEDELQGDSYIEAEQRAIESGDELAIASKLNYEDELPSEMVDLAIKIAEQTSNPEALMHALMAITKNDVADMRIKSIQGRLFNMYDTPEARGSVISYAALWAACQAGKADCGSYTIEADSDCIYLGECYSQLSRMDYIRTRMLSARQFEQMQRYLQLLNEEVLHRQ